jgi:polysaccharide deacetylase 2 family uncharacterized protein YibQ
MRRRSAGNPKMIKRSIAVLLSIAILIVAILIAPEFIRRIPARYIPQNLQNIFLYFSMHDAQGNTVSRFEALLTEALIQQEVHSEDIKTRNIIQDSLLEITARIPRGRPLEWIVFDLCRSADETSHTVDDCMVDKRTGICTIEFLSPDKHPPRIRLILKPSDRFSSKTAKIAILIEDFEFQADQTTINILSFPHPLTISLDPLSKKSAWTAQAADQYAKEVVIRLAFEPHVKVSLPPSLPLILVHFSADSIHRIIAESVKSIPNFAGFNNVLGSRALEDTRLMDIVLRDILKRHGYFVESKTARNSIVPSLAASMGLAYAGVSTVISEKASSDDIEAQLRHCCIVARKKGTMLVSARAGVELITALNKIQDTFSRNGIKLVYVSEIADDNRTRKK